MKKVKKGNQQKIPLEIIPGDDALMSSTTKPLPDLVLSEKARRLETSKLKNVNPRRPHFLATKITIGADSLMPGIEDMRGTSTEMDAGMFVLMNYLEM